MPYESGADENGFGKQVIKEIIQSISDLKKQMNDFQVQLQSPTRVKKLKLKDSPGTRLPTLPYMSYTPKSIDSHPLNV